MADSIPHVVWITQLNPERVVYVSPSFEQVYGRKPQELYDDPRVWTECIHPDDRHAVEQQFVGWISGRSRDCQKLEYRIVTPSGTQRWVTDHGVVTFDASGRPVRVSGVSTDITELKLAEQEHLAHVHFLESLDRINQVIQRGQDLEEMLSEVLEVALEVLGADRAWLAFPCGPEMPSWRVMLERCSTAAPRVSGEADHAATSGGAAVLDAVRSSDDVLGFGRSDAPVPEDLARAFGVKAALCTPLHPRVGARYVFGLHQCAHHRAWSVRERQLFREISRRLADAISMLWTFRGLRESEARLEAAQRQARLGYWTLDVEASVITGSDETMRILGVASRELPLSIARADELVYPPDRERVRQARREALEQSGAYAVEYRTLSPATGLRYLNSEGQVVRDARGRPVGIFGTLQDITARKRAEQFFATQHAVTRLLVEATRIEEATRRVLEVVCESLGWDLAVLWRLDRQTRLLRCNEIWAAPGLRSERFEALARSSTFAQQAGLPGRAWWERGSCFVADLRHETGIDGAVAAAEAGFRTAFAVPIPLGSEVWGVIEFYAEESRPREADLLTTMATIGSQVGQFVERMEAETALQQARDELAHVTRVATLGEMTASIAHEVNQPLTGIVVNANAALRWLAHSPPNLEETGEALRRLARDGKRAGEVITRLRTLVRKGELPSKTELDPNQVIRETLPLVRSELHRNDVSVRLSLAPDVGQVRADLVQFQQVLINLIVNAVEALATEKRRPRELAIASRNHESGCVAITVTDNGPGLPAENLVKIFTPFFTTKPQGLGMGLTISRSIVEDHGGQLAVASSDIGTSFEFTLSRADD